MTGSSRVVVVGAGILGASVAYHVARAGAQVTLLDAGQPGSGVTTDSFAWIGSSGERLGPAAQIRLIATDDYHRIEAELPGLPVTWSGSLCWGAADTPSVAGPGQEIVDADRVASLEPALRKPPEWAVWAPGDGAVDAVGVTTRLVEGARSLDAAIHSDTAVTGLVRDPSGRVVGVDTSAGRLSGTTVVLAAGVATAALAATIGVEVPVEPSPSTLFRFRGPRDLVRTVVHNQDFDLRQVGPDRLISAADSAEETLAAIRATFRGSEAVELVSSAVGARPMPVDGEPIVGPVADAPGLYVAVMHAAVTLAPIMGRLIAEEVVHGAAQASLQGCRLDRF